MNTPIRIPHPCAQSWDKMSPSQDGRFCTSCEKTVYDLTRLSNEQLIDFLNRNGRGICGRFRAGQVSETPVRKSLFYSMKMRAAAFAAFFFARLAPAGTQAQENNSTVLPPEPQQDKIKNVKSDSVIYHVSGSVLSDYDASPVAGARVYVKAGKQFVEFAKTDEDGNFELNIPAGNNKEKIEIVIRRQGYKEARYSDYLPDAIPLTVIMKSRKRSKPAPHYYMGCPAF